MGLCSRENVMGQERTVRVGIVKAERLRVAFDRPYVSDGVSLEGEHTFTVADTPRLFQPSSPEAFFTLPEVTIGIGFHWQREQSLSFCGALLLVEEQGRVRAINVVPVEAYLTSVISSEMSAQASPELLKAHAVISRSWLMRMMERGDEPPRPTGRQFVRGNRRVVLRWYDTEAHTGFDVCADDHCQRYQGITRQTNPNVQAAIEATRGEVLTCDGHICDARFSKCCGGQTETFENCWEHVRHPYLQSFCDPYCNTSDSRVLAQVLNDYDQETRDFYRWTVSYTADQLSDIVRRKSGIDFGRILHLEPLRRGGSGRIVSLRVVGEKETAVVGKELEIRKWLSETHLYSSAFDVEETPGGFTLHGRGWGHGVGLCQIGAAVMGEQGIPYRDILQFYYPGTELTRLW